MFLKTNTNGIKPAQCGGVGNPSSLALSSILVSILTLALPQLRPLVRCPLPWLFYVSCVLRVRNPPKSFPLQRPRCWLEPRRYGHIPPAGFLRPHQRLQPAQHQRRQPPSAARPADPGAHGDVHTHLLPLSPCFLWRVILLLCECFSFTKRELFLNHSPSTNFKHSVFFLEN